MLMPVSNRFNNIRYSTPSFQSKSKNNTSGVEGDNPISRKGEVMNLIKTTFVGGLVLGGKLLLELVEDGDFVLDKAWEYSKKSTKATTQKERDKIANELKQEKDKIKSKQILRTIGAFVALIAAGLCGFALLYTAYNAPKIKYDSKVNTFKKSKEMDVYIKANEAERELYEQLDEKAKNADIQEKEQLKTQYMQMKNAKNQVPDFVNLKM